jgi:colanic acid/amylovoran biosynthesis glycosyltransferase
MVVAHFVRGFLHPNETFIGNQIGTLDRYEPVVYCRRILSGHSFECIQAKSVPALLTPSMRIVEDLAYSRFRSLTPMAARRVCNHLLAQSSRLLHFHYLVDARFFLRVCRMAGLPTVVSAYGYDVSSFPLSMSGLGLYYLHPIFNRLDLFLAMSNDMREDLLRLGCSPEKVIVHYHGIRVDRFAYPLRTYVQPEVVTILVCGQLIPKKGHAVLLHALAKTIREGIVHHPLRLVVVGGGPLRSNLEGLVKHLGLQNIVIFKGPVPHHQDALLEEYRQADIFALPSLTAGGAKEGIPGALIEAMASGLPVISTRHAGIPEVVSAGRDGVLVDEGDSEGLATALARLILHPRMREDMGSAAARKAQECFDVRTRSRTLEGIYDEVIARHSSSDSLGTDMRP